jgi:hypothetical protein
VLGFKLGYIIGNKDGVLLGRTLGSQDGIKAQKQGASCLNILPIGQVTVPICRVVGAGPGTGELRYFVYNFPIGDEISMKGRDKSKNLIHQESMFVFPGI